jgi:hypothetical protein
MTKKPNCSALSASPSMSACTNLVAMSSIGQPRRSSAIS